MSLARADEGYFPPPLLHLTYSHTHTYTPDARSSSLRLLQALANTTIAKGYLKKQQGESTAAAGGADIVGGQRQQPRWQRGEEALHAKLEVGLWDKRIQSQQRLEKEVERMETTVIELQEALNILSTSKEEETTASFASISRAYLEELLTEAVQALREESKMCRKVLQESGQTSDHEAHLLYSSAWAMRPLLKEHRLRALRELVQLELAAGG